MFNIMFANQIDTENSTLFSVETRPSSFQSLDDEIKNITNANDFFEFTRIISSGIPVSDRGLNYGDGTFTTMYFHQDLGLCLFDEHLNRLESACARLFINFSKPLIKHLVLCVIDKFISQQNPPLHSKTFIVKLLITRGSGGRGYAPPKNQHPLVVLSLYDCKEFTGISDCQPINCGVANIQLSHQPVLAGLKHTSRLEQVLAKQELATSSYSELLVTDKDGFVIEATAANVFLLKNDCWLTPKLDLCGVEGVMREALLEFMRNQDVSFEIAKVHLNDLQDCDTGFICNALNPFVPINTIQSTMLNIDVKLDAAKSVDVATNFNEWLACQKFSRPQNSTN